MGEGTGRFTLDGLAQGVLLRLELLELLCQKLLLGAELFVDRLALVELPLLLCQG